MSNKEDSLKAVLKALRYENLSGSEIARQTGLSQPTVSRVLKEIPVIKLGGGRSSLYGLVETSSRQSLYKVGQDGRISALGVLYSQPMGMVITQGSGEYEAYDSLPYFLYDSIPSGFLGNSYLKKLSQSDSRITLDSGRWSDEQILYYLTVYGEDLPGNIIVGRAMAEKASQKSLNLVSREQYSQITNDIVNASLGGSSVGGEQPKFTIYNGEHLIVKYSPSSKDINPVSARHRDLMYCEHLALKTLDSNGIDATRSTIHVDDRVYLELSRFDRQGAHGRSGIVSLRMVDAQFSGKGRDWITATQDLFEQDLISKEDLETSQITYAFGLYIGNTDMHNGNLSFHMEGLKPSGLTPIYDMLPMAFMPKQGELVNPSYQIPRFIDIPEECRTRALDMANQFWDSVSESLDISKEFKMATSALQNEVYNLSTKKFNDELSLKR